jgi:hypothetical protein
METSAAAATAVSVAAGHTRRCVAAAAGAATALLLIQQGPLPCASFHGNSNEGRPHSAPHTSAGVSSVYPQEQQQQWQG